MFRFVDFNALVMADTLGELRSAARQSGQPM